ncbi:hypothetical protein [uncultured Prevotella sp.]|uniref:hypothetical protein n=1 Tax=uncultured Prevotella sp. TaxID=159272 RepID=UPI00258882C7|nr:hypothetical protein [uncultured Prevotella sp.]
MRDNYKEPKLTYALDSSGKMVHIGCVERGLLCNCRCPKCNEFLVAKLGHEGGRQAHFAHVKGSDCHGSYMSALHKLAEQIIEEERAVMAPAYKEINKQKLEFETVEIEQRVERKDLQPDIVGVTSDGLRWFIEIRNTHEVGEAKRFKLIESNITCLEIDVREQTLENLKSFLLDSSENREWINNPNYDSQIAEAKRVKVSQVEKLLFDNQEFVIPEYGKYEIQKVHFDKLFVVNKSDDGLFVRVKAYSTEGIPYILNIGSQELLNNMPPSFQKETDCNELAINADSVYSDSTIHSCFLDTKWLYHSQSEKEHEAKIREYRSNSQYEVRPRTDCYSKCKYRPFFGKCIYSKEIISNQGVDYVVCQKERRRMEEFGDSSRNQINNSRSSSYTWPQSLDRTYQKNKPKERNYTKISQIKPIQEASIAQSRSESLHDDLPFDRFWTIEEFLTQLNSTGSYETEKGLLAVVEKYHITGGGILLLYRDHAKVRTYCPFHLAIINVSKGNLIRNKVADFSNRKAALDSYYTRLDAMRSNVYLKRSEDNSDNGLPF